ncbi:PH domain-containing protein [Companilactobacillus huachuanensis]|uniref:PH domain-containing protein n=1 Tax=Companilactobacillus huachuanensis TaxID=2559914 RepID=A0ABW1RH13_9LACO|nr:PH domain-containing protein [Companilactobacillus huachuanensis]
MDKIKELPRSIKAVWRIHATIEFIIFVLIMIGVGLIRLVLPTTFKGYFDLIMIIIWGLGMIVFIGSMFLVNYLWTFWTYYIDERQIQLHSGYFFRKQVIIPIARVQNVTLKQGPILRWKDLQKVVIVTASGRSEIDGILSDQADQLKETIMQLAQEAKNDM